MTAADQRESVAFGRGIITALALILIIAGVTVAWTVPDSGPFIGAALVALGGTLLIRLAIIAGVRW